MDITDLLKPRKKPFEPIYVNQEGDEILKRNSWPKATLPVSEDRKSSDVRIYHAEDAPPLNKGLQQQSWKPFKVK